VDDLHHLNSSVTPQEQHQQNRHIGPLGMSRDSLNGTITRTNLFQSNDNQHEQPKPISESHTTGQITSTEADLDPLRATANIQRWYQENHTTLEQEKPTHDEYALTPRVRFSLILLNLYSSNRTFINNKILLDYMIIVHHLLVVHQAVEQHLYNHPVHHLFILMK
jgi:hypothetical protein